MIATTRAFSGGDGFTKGKGHDLVTLDHQNTGLFDFDGGMYFKVIV